MPGSETVYTFPVARAAVYERGRETISDLPIELDGAAVAATIAGCSCRVLGPSGEAVATVTVVDGGGGTPRIVWTPSTTLAFGAGYTEVWTVKIGTATYTVRRSFSIRRYELHPPVSQDALVQGEYPDLLQQLGPYQSSVQPYLDAVWAEVLRKLDSLGSPAATIVEPSDVYDWVRHEVLARIWKALLASAENDRWRELWQYHRDEARAARDSLRYTVDRDEDGVPDGSGKVAPARQVHPNLPYTLRPARPWRW